MKSQANIDVANNAKLCGVSVLPQPDENDIAKLERIYSKTRHSP